ncbi:MAG: LOG family protein, partial [Polyangiales bacterium]
LTGIQLRYHNKGVVFLDVDGFWTRMSEFLDHAAHVGVLRPEMRALFRTASSASAALDALENW